MAQVWRATHTLSGDAVALKVVTAELAARPEHVRAFRDEVRATATLDHPGIVRPLDEGHVPHDFDGDEALTPGAPFLAMELVEGPPLTEYGLTLGWPEVRGLLLDLLDALAHAHAHGIVHRDLKPANVLVDATGPRPRVKLSDFGIARALDALKAPLEDSSRVTGTPRYMAPEQILSEWRDQGPWTDLYALGCLAHWLVCGRVPYDAESPFETFRAHIHAPLPPLRPRFAVPDGLEAWVHALLAKDHRARFQRAADASWQLARMGEPSALRPLAATSDEGAAPEEPTALLDSSPHEPGAGDPLRPTADEARAPTRPMPGTWRLPRGRPTGRADLLGAGLALFPLRPVPMTGRDDACDALHAALARTSRGPGVAIVRGTSGVGKSRLVEWFSRRAHELGAATNLRALHDPSPGPLLGLGGCITRALRLHGLDRAAATARALDWLRARGASGPGALHDAAALAQLASTEPASPTGSSVTFTAPAERFAVLARFLERAALERPLVVWLDDAQWAMDALDFTSWFLARSQAPVLFVATARDDALAERPHERRALATLSESAWADLTLGPLPEAAHRDLISRSLHLAPELVDRVAARTHGNPLFAIQLVGALVERGALAPSPRGFVLQGAEPEIPDSLHEIWLERLDRVLSSLPDASRLWRALELAACLGHTFSLAEWRWVCQRLGLSWSPELLDRLRRVRLLELDAPADEATFAHPMLQESLARRARELDRDASMHLACAALAGTQTDTEPRAWLRAGHHLVAARAWARALPALLEAATRAMEQGDFPLCHAALDLHARACRADPSHDPASALDGDLLRGWMHGRQGRAEDAQIIVERVITSARLQDLDGVLGRALTLRARLERMTRPADAMDTLARAISLLADTPDRRTYGKALLARGWILGRGGDIDAGLAGITRARDVFASIPDPRWVIDADLSLAYVLAQDGRFGEATRRIRDAARHAQSIGAVELEAKCENTLGECARFTGRWADATDHYQRARALHAVSGGLDQPVYDLNLALSALGAGDLDAAGALLSSLDRQWRLLTHQGLEPLVLCARVWWLSASRRWDDLARELGHTRHSLADAGLVERDITDCLTRTRTACVAADQSDLADMCDAALETQKVE
jgi:tetratricopeptide (TPR) repeat protein